eukprot:CAMPEP_0196740594 /NCGR_PEP_ID=MMETSP1091-20130531/33740_1 /TAXON_ID=302021 /ORGANISM="Rhodomonas sp., Strain CCMP768" /LENGTH=303 /DNA_ID=CAMNT_0042085827 /DNA_START=185 /DNA_END=1097 /DNA_ORIENTATION=+
MSVCALLVTRPAHAAASLPPPSPPLLASHAIVMLTSSLFALIASTSSSSPLAVLVDLERLHGGVQVEVICDGLVPVRKYNLAPHQRKRAAQHRCALHVLHRRCGLSGHQTDWRGLEIVLHLLRHELKPLGAALDNALQRQDSSIPRTAVCPKFRVEAQLPVRCEILTAVEEDMGSSSWALMNSAALVGLATVTTISSTSLAWSCGRTLFRFAASSQQNGHPTCRMKHTSALFFPAMTSPILTAVPSGVGLRTSTLFRMMDKSVGSPPPLFDHANFGSTTSGSLPLKAKAPFLHECLGLEQIFL